MRLKDIRGLPVVDPTAARKIGTVSDYLVDPASGRLAALEVQGRDGNRDERIPAPHIRRIGQHAVVLTGRMASGSDSSADNERWLDSASLVNLEVLGDDGNRVGRLSDASFDQDSLEIEAYLLHASLWQRFFGRHRGRILPNQVASCSRELMIISSGRLAEATPPEPPPQEENTTEPLGVPLKLEDRVPAPSGRKKATATTTDGQAVPTLGHTD